MLTTMHPAYKNTLKKKAEGTCREDREDRKSRWVWWSKPHSSSVQRHSSHSKCTLLINSIRSHRERGTDWWRGVRCYTCTTSPVSSVTFSFALAILLSFFPLTVPSIQLSFLLSQSLSGPGQIAQKKSKVQEAKWKIIIMIWLLTGNLLFSVFLFSWSVTPYPLLHCRKRSVCIPAWVLCQSDRRKLLSVCMSIRVCVCVWENEWVSACVCEREKEREGECVRLSLCLALLWVSKPRLF